MTYVRNAGPHRRHYIESSILTEKDIVMRIADTSVARAGHSIRTLAGSILRIGLFIPLMWIGLDKFTRMEAEAIAPLISSSPLMSWIYDIAGIQTVSSVLGVFEIAAAVLIVAKPLSARLSALGSVIAVGLFISTTSFLLTTPGVVADSTLGIPMLTDIGGFLIKDIVLLGAALWTLGDSLESWSREGGASHASD